MHVFLRNGTPHSTSPPHTFIQLSVRSGIRLVMPGWQHALVDLDALLSLPAGPRVDAYCAGSGGIELVEQSGVEPAEDLLRPGIRRSYVDG